MDLGLTGKVALVTAASKGMGRACALGLAAEGARVAMCARNEGELKTAADEIRATTKADVLAVRADVTKAAGLAREEYLARQSKAVPRGRPGSVEEFANVAVFLASERASYVTGVAIQVDGGLVRGLL